MKVVKKWASGLQHIRYDYADADALKSSFSSIRPDLIDKLCQWLKDNNSVIDAIDCYDAQSGWEGTNFMIGNADLSMNGYCLRNSSIELFLSGGQNHMWYRSWRPEYEMARKWQEEHN